MKKIYILALALLLAGCGAKAEPVLATALPETVEAAEPTQEQPLQTELPGDPILELLAAMSPEEKVGQMILARCPETGAPEDIARYRPGGFVLFGQDFEGQTPDTLREKLRSFQAASRIPMLLAVDEEGGTVTRVSGFKAFRPEPFPSPRSLYERGGLELVLSLESEKAFLLSDLGLNVNLAPVCDIAQRPGSFLYSRSLGADPETTGQFVSQSLQRMAEYGVGGVMKHFPGYGENGDTHLDGVMDDRPLSELESRDLLPFAAGIQTGLGAVMLSHNTVTALDPQNPASLSGNVVAYLREEMGFSGVILTDDLSMGALKSYSSGQSGVMAVKAGVTMLCSTDYVTQIQAILDAVSAGEIPETVIDDAVYRILTWKHQLGLL